MLENIELLMLLFLAHVIADFYLQPNSWVRNKKEKGFCSSKLYLHAFIHAVFAGLVIAIWSCSIQLILSVFAITFVSHVLIDALKKRTKDSIGYFAMDQLLHSIIIFIIYCISINYTTKWSVETVQIVTKISTVLLGYILILKPSSISTELIIKRWGETNNQGLENAGCWIGYLERILVVTFILLGYYEGIGFLLAAKSIFRFGELTKSKERELTEYILIGTLLSFTIALFIGLGIRFLIRL